MMSETDDDLSLRFGQPDHYEELFLTMDHNNLREDFVQLSSNKGKSSFDNDYEISRQHFLQVLGKHTMIWYPLNRDVDLDVEVSRLYRQDPNEYLAFMRIQRHGYKAERVVPSCVEMVFHVLMGRVIFYYRKKTKTVSRGQFITIASRSTYSIRSLDEDQPSYLIFKVGRIKNNKPKAIIHDDHEVIVIE